MFNKSKFQLIPNRENTTLKIDKFQQILLAGKNHSNQSEGIEVLNWNEQNSLSYTISNYKTNFFSTDLIEVNALHQYRVLQNYQVPYYS